MVARAAHIVQRDRTYHFRRKVPKHLKIRFPIGELSCSLKTANRGLAGRRARQLYLFSDDLFRLVEDEDPGVLSQEKLAAIVQDFYALVLRLESEGRLKLPALSEADRENRARRYAERAQSLRLRLARNDLDGADWVRPTVAKHVDFEKLDRVEQQQVRQSLMRAAVELSDALKDRFEGNFDHEPSDPLFKVRVGQPLEPKPKQGSFAKDREQLIEAKPAVSPSVNSHLEVEPLAQVASVEEALSDECSGELFAITSKAFTQKQVKTAQWEKQTAAQASKSYELFQALNGNLNLSRYTRQHAVKFKNTIEQLPADYGKATAYRGLSIPQILESAAAEAPRLSSRTVQRHISALSALWEGLIVPLGKPNIFSDFRFSHKVRAREQRSMWSRANLQKLFATPVWRGCRSASRRTAPGSMIIRDEKFWLPLLAVFTGAREEELCQLHCVDVRLEEGIWVIDINAKPPRRLKNATAVRLVPLHNEIVRVGFLNYVDELRGQGQTRVFPRLKPGGADGRFGHNFTKWFTRYRQDLGLYEPGLDFHSFRHSATTFLHQGGVEDSVLDRLTGHTTTGETARYTKGSNIGQLADAIQRMDTGLDLSSLYET